MLCFLTSGPLISKCTFLRLQHFFSPSTCSINSIFSVVIGIYKIHLFDEAFFLLPTVAMINTNYFQGNKLFNHNHAAYQSLLINPCCLSIPTMPSTMEANRKRQRKKVITGEYLLSYG